jgi:NADH dehydrogenase (ubiquinone) 1 alpha subcomplex subunit 13
MWARIHLTPLLQAEEDRDQVRRHYADAEREKTLLGSDEGFKLGKGIYHGDRFVRPTYAVTPEKPLKD